MMNLLDLPPRLFFLELFFMLMTVLSAFTAIQLIRAARRPLDFPKKPSNHMPSTPLTRGKPKRVPRELSEV